MELIAASRIVKAQARVHAAQPYAEASPRSCATCRRRAVARTARCSRRAPRCARSRDIVIAADRGLCGGYNSVGDPRRRARRCARAARAGPRVRARHRRPQGRGLLPVPRLPDRRARSPASATAPPTRTPARSRPRSIGRFQAGEIDLVQLVYTRFISAGRQEVVVEPLLPLERDEDRRPRRRRADGEPSGATSSSPSPKRSSTRCCRATPSRASTPRCSTRPRRSTPPASAR